MREHLIKEDEYITTLNKNLKDINIPNKKSHEKIVEVPTIEVPIIQTLTHIWGDRYLVHNKVPAKNGKFKTDTHWERKCSICDITQRWGKKFGTRNKPQYDDTISQLCAVNT